MAIILFTVLVMEKISFEHENYRNQGSQAKWILTPWSS